jgi:hypothetical protein
MNEFKVKQGLIVEPLSGTTERFLKANTLGLIITGTTGSTDLSNYYTKPQIDSGYTNYSYSKSIIDSGLTLKANESGLTNYSLTSHTHTILTATTYGNAYDLSGNSYITGSTSIGNYLSLSGGTLTGSLTGTTSYINSYDLSGIPYITSNDLSAYSLTSHTHNQYALETGLTIYAKLSDLSAYSLTSHTHSIYSLTSHTHSIYLPLAGGTMTGTLTARAITLQTTYNLTITNLSASTERVITTSGSGILQNYLTTSNKWITSISVITNIINESNWSGDTYIGSITGLTEGQEYIGIDYRFLFQNNIITRYNLKPTTNLIMVDRYDNKRYDVYLSGGTFIMEEII